MRVRELCVKAFYRGYFAVQWRPVSVRGVRLSLVRWKGVGRVRLSGHTALSVLYRLWFWSSKLHKLHKLHIVIPTTSSVM